MFISPDRLSWQKCVQPRPRHTSAAMTKLSGMQKHAPAPTEVKLHHRIDTFYKTIWKKQLKACVCPPVALHLITGGQEAHIRNTYRSKYLTESIKVSVMCGMITHTHIHSLSNRRGVYNPINMSNIRVVCLSFNLSAVSAIFLFIISMSLNIHYRHHCAFM